MQLANECQLTSVERKIFEKKWQHNSYFAHPEWILTAALFDPDLQTRRKAVLHILEDRKRRLVPGHEMRKFEKPTVNFKATSYLKMIDFNTCDPAFITEPPITFDYTDAQLKLCASGKDLILPDIPIHSLNNERAVQETTKACKAFATYEQRVANIIQTLKSRQNLPKHPNKSDFV